MFWVCGSIILHLHPLVWQLEKRDSMETLRKVKRGTFEYADGPLTAVNRVVTSLALKLLLKRGNVS